MGEFFLTHIRFFTKFETGKVPALIEQYEQSLKINQEEEFHYIKWSTGIENMHQQNTCPILAMKNPNQQRSFN